jgi:putative heme iron utilization protein
MIQYFLREDTQDLEDDVKRAVEQTLGTDVYLLDLREALVRVGADHIDEVADELRDWGYRYRE